MALELRIVGPGLDVSRRLLPGDPALTLGRDTDCSICLPDPERNVSRRHLSVWNEGDELQFHVLSVVNGVDLPTGEVAPGGRGTLRITDSLLLSTYRLSLSVIHDDDLVGDPWAVFDHDAGHTTLPAGQDTLPASALDEDPFGDWGFESTFAPGSPGGALQADALVAATDLRPFYAGLGMDPARLPTLSQGELESIGRLTRMALVGLLQAAQLSSIVKEELRAEDRTMVGARETNPLRMDGTPDAKLQYLFGGRTGAATFLPPDRAVAEVVTELVAHIQSLGVAVDAAVAGTVGEFDPDKLKARLLGTGGRLFESARAWDAFVRDYNEQKGDMRHWVQRLLDRHFVEAYIRESMRVRRDTAGPKRRS